MPKAEKKSRGEEEEDVPIHGTTNEEEARIYSEALDNIIFQMGVSVKDEKVDAIKEAIENYKEKMANMFPNMATANTAAVHASIKDKVGLCLYPQMDQKDKLLENIISAEEVTSAVEVIGKVGDITPEERDIIKELFDSLEVAHSHLAMACSSLSQLSATMRATDLRTVLEASIRPVITIRTTTA